MKTIVLWGFLGSGKTTFINHLLHTILKDKRVVVLENESGKESVDGMWLRSRKVQVVDMKAGCVCCSLRNELPQVMSRIESTIHPEILIIEPSGLAALEDLLTIQSLKIDLLLTLIDVKSFPFLMKLNPDHYKRQFNLSPAIILTKTDITEATVTNQVIDALHTIAPSADIYTGYRTWTAAEWSVIVKQQAAGRSGLTFIYGSNKTDSIKVETFPISTRVCLSSMEHLLNTMKEESTGLIRIKGFLKEVSGRYLKVDEVCGEVKLELMPSDFTADETALSIYYDPQYFKAEALMDKITQDAHVVPCEMKDLIIEDTEIYSYLGFGESKPDAYMSDFINRLKREAIDVCHPLFGYRLVEGRRIDKDYIELNGIPFKPGAIISHALKKSERFFILLATVGKELDRWIHEKRDGGDVMEAFIADALGSTIVEATVAYALQHLEQTVALSQMKISNSYSPGYCGWDVSEQQSLFSLLPPLFCGVSLTDSSLMLPIKSVSAVIGVGADIERKGYRCDSCLKKDCYKRRIKN